MSEKRKILAKLAHKTVVALWDVDKYRLKMERKGKINADESREIDNIITEIGGDILRQIKTNI